MNIISLLGLNKVYLIAGAALLAVLAVFYFQNQSLREDNRILTENNVKLEGAVEQQKDTINAALDTIDQWEARLQHMQQTMQALAEVQEEANATNRRLIDVFGAHDLEALSLEKPGIIERRINRGTADAFGLLERSTEVGNTDDSSGPEETE